MNTARKLKPDIPWHQADIKAALAKKDYTFAKIAREHGYGETSPNTVLWRPWAKMEKIISIIIDVKPQVIWPDRYDRTGKHLGTRKR